MKNIQSILFAMGMALGLIGAPASAMASAPKFMIVVLENTDYDDAARQRFMGSLMKSGTLFTQFFAVARPSQPNYFAMVGGSTFNALTNQNVDLPHTHIGDQLEAKGRTWRVYAEDYPGNCFLGAKHKQYVRKHNPMISFINVQKDPRRCAMIQDTTNLESDIVNNTLADVSLVIPNNDSNGHDTGVAYADRWLDQTFGRLIREKRFPEDLVFILTFDEASKFTRDNRIFTVFYGANVQVQTDAKPYTLYSLTRLIQDTYGLGTLGREDAKANPITGFYKREYNPLHERLRGRRW